jgi:hypothetical protein
MADLEAVRVQLKQLKQRFALSEMTQEEYERRREAITAELSAEEHIQLGVMSVTEPAEGASRQEPPTSAETPAAAPPPESAAGGGMPAFPDLDDSVFQDEVQPEAAAATEPDEEAVAITPETEPESPPKAWLVPAIAGSALLFVVIGALLIFTRSPAEAPAQDTVAVVNELLTEGKAWFDAGQGAEAVTLLEEGLGRLPADDPGRGRVERRISEYREELARPAPSPKPAAAAQAEELLAQGLTLAAYTRVAEGLAAEPDKEDLLDLHEQLVSEEPLLRSLHAALAEEDYATAAFVAETLATRNPEHPEYSREVRRCLFNAAVLALRAAQVGDAREHLESLAELEPGDAEVGRLLEFAGGYANREPDARLEIFANSLKLR